MDKEFEKALKCLEKLGDRAYKRYFFTEESLEELKTPIKQALLELKSIKEANSNEALKDLEVINSYGCGINNNIKFSEVFEKEYTTIKQALTTKSKKEQAFDIIKKKGLDKELFQRCDNFREYNKNLLETYKGTTYYKNSHNLKYTEQEFNLLKEVLK